MQVKFIADDECRTAWSNLKRWRYPHDKKRYPYAVMLGVYNSRAVAHVFFEVSPDNPDILLLHMGADPRWRGRWLTREVCSKLTVAAELLGGRRIYVITSLENVNKLCVKYGFQQDQAGYYLDI